MISFTQVYEPPKELSQKAQEAWGRSVYVWQVGYGLSTRLTDHTHLGYLGLVALDYLTKRGYWWYELGDAKPTRPMLQEAKLAFADLVEVLGWETYAHTELEKSAHLRFARAFGFRVLGSNNEAFYLKRS